MNIRSGSSAGLALVLTCVSPAALANGFGESSPWQFHTPSERAANVAVTDLIERKRGGYYDGFTTNVYNSNVTNIGSQVNCNNIATAIGNEASNGQSGNSIATNLDGSVLAQSSGNSAINDLGVDGGTSGTTQTNSGTQNSDVTDSNISLSNGGSATGSSRNDLLNDQDNSGDQTAGIHSSTACDMTGATITGNVDGSYGGQVLNMGSAGGQE